MFVGFLRDLSFFDLLKVAVCIAVWRRVSVLADIPVAKDAVDQLHKCRASDEKQKEREPRASAHEFKKCSYG